MSRFVLMLVFVAALVGVGWLVFSGAFDDAGSDGPARADAEEPATETATGPDASDTGAAADGPRLFGRPAAQRIGVGAVGGRVAILEEGGPVSGARLLLVGVGYGDEEVGARARSAEDGTFLLSSIPAGEGYTLRVEADGLPSRTVPGIAVADDEHTGLGTLWLGGKADLEGRVLDPDGQPIANARVRAHLGHFSMAEMMTNFADMISNLDQEPVALAATTTLNDGTFRLEGLDPGPVTVVVVASGYRIAITTAVVGATADEARVLDIRMASARTISGRVVDETGGGIAGARIAIMDGSDPATFVHGRTFTESASDGSFRVTTAPEGTDLALIAGAAGYPPTFVELKGRQDTVEVVMRRGTELTVEVVAGPRTEGVAGAQVVLAIGSSEGFQGPPDTMLSGQTDATGRAVFAARPGTLMLAIIRHPDHAPGMWAGQMGMGGMGMMQMEGPEDALLPEGAATVRFVLPEVEFVVGTVTGPDDEPLPGARVMTMGMMQMTRPTLADDQGRYRLAVSGSEMAFLVQADGFVQGEMQTIDRENRNEKGEIVFDISMERAVAVSGRVEDEAGHPVAGARIRVRGGEQGFGIASMLGRSSEGISGRDGRFLIDGVAPGKGLVLVARHPEFVDSASETFDLPKGTTSHREEVTMEVGHELEVEVHDPSGRPLPDAFVLVNVDREFSHDFDMFEDESIPSVRTDEAGHARVPRVPVGAAHVTARHPEYAEAHGNVPVSGTEDARVVVEMARPMRVSGRILAPDGKPVAGAYVQAAGVGVRTGADGAFILEQLPEGVVTVDVYTPGFLNRSLEVPGPAEGLEIFLDPVDPNIERRRGELNQEMQELSREFASASAEEKQVLGERMQQIAKELGELAGDEPVAASSPAEEVTEDASASDDP